MWFTYTHFGNGYIGHTQYFIIVTRKDFRDRGLIYAGYTTNKVLKAYDDYKREKQKENKNEK